MLSYLKMAVEITIAQASHAKMSPDEVDHFLKVTFERLRQMKQVEEGVQEAAEEATEAAPPVVPLKSIQRNKVICLECGRAFRQLTNAHLKSHGLTSREYKKKWGLPLKQPLAERLRQVREARKTK